MKPVSVRREGMPMPGGEAIEGPREEAYGLMMIPDEYGRRFHSRGAGGTFTLDVLIDRADALAFKNASSDEERQAILDKYVSPTSIEFDTKKYHIPRGALLGSTVVYEVEEKNIISTLDL